MDDLPGTREIRSKLETLAVRRFRLAVTEGEDVGLTRDSTATELAIGTDPANQLVLTDPTVSRHHCVIAASPRGFRLRDLGSTNGTFVNHLQVEAAYLKPGALVRLGQSVVRFEVLDDEVREALSPDEHFGVALGRSVSMRRLFAVLAKIASSDSTVLLEGETGTGKTLIAEAIHQASRRADGPFVAVDCGSLPPTLIESELFGHLRGSFTGAVADRPGAFEAAHGGTLFLDEVGEVPLDLQAKLLRALEEKLVKRIGAPVASRVDLRVIAATNRDLREAVNRGAFRADLFYRLNVARLRVPSLRERKDDIPLLVTHFYRRFMGDDQAVPPAELVDPLREHAWPGNVRELRSAVERAVLMADPAYWADLEAPGAAPSSTGAFVFDEALSYRIAKERLLAEWERWFTTELLKRHDGNLTRAARAARMDRAHLRELLRRHKAPAADDE